MQGRWGYCRSSATADACSAQSTTTRPAAHTVHCSTLITLPRSAVGVGLFTSPPSKARLPRLASHTLPRVLAMRDRERQHRKGRWRVSHRKARLRQPVGPCSLPHLAKQPRRSLFRLQPRLASTTTAKTFCRGLQPALNFPTMEPVSKPLRSRKCKLSKTFRRLKFHKARLPWPVGPVPLMQSQTATPIFDIPQMESSIDAIIVGSTILVGCLHGYGVGYHTEQHLSQTKRPKSAFATIADRRTRRLRYAVLASARQAKALPLPIANVLGVIGGNLPKAAIATLSMQGTIGQSTNPRPYPQRCA